MSDLDKKTNKSEDKADGSGKVIINLNDIESRHNNMSHQDNVESMKRINEMAQNFIIPRLDLTNYTDGINQSIQSLFDTINTSNFRHISVMQENIANINMIFDGLTNTIISTQKRAIDEMMNALTLGINYDSFFQNIDNIFWAFQEKITPMMIESISNNIEKLSEIDFSGITFSNQDISQAMDALENDEFEIEMKREIAKEKELSKIPSSIKTVILVICFIIRFSADFITVWNFTDKKIIPLAQEYFDRKQTGVFHTEEAGLTWLNDSLKDELSEQFRNNFRVVSKDELIVRVGKSNDSRFSGTLNTGYIVQVIEKKRNWTYIMYTDNDKEIVIEGWTNTRYLKQIK